MTNFPPLIIIGFALLFFLCSCNNSDKQPEVEKRQEMTVEQSKFGIIGDQTIYKYTMSNSEMTVDIINYGGIIKSIYTKDRNGKVSDIVHGFDNLDGYLGEHPYFGATIGRYGNRIANGTFIIDGETYNVPKNNGPNGLHGGIKGFDKKVWSGKTLESKAIIGVELTSRSLDTEEGYPGNLDVKVLFTLTKNNRLSITYNATADKATVCNLTNHSYFNLNGHDNGDILDHELMIDADAITPVDETLIPTGQLMELANGPFDFRESHKIGERINADDPQIRFGNGYDHNFVLNNQSNTIKMIAKARSPESGRTLTVYTTEPGVQFYTGNFLDGTVTGKDGAVYNQRTAFCLETQHYPDSPNHPNFPTTVLRPGEQYSTQTIYEFGVE